MSGQRPGPAALPAGETSYPLERRLDGSGKSRLHRGSDPRTVQAVANRYNSTDRAGEPF